MLSKNEENYLGIDQAMRNIPPIPLSPRQIASVAKIKPYPFILIGAIYLIFIIVPLVKGGDAGLFAFMVTVATVIAGIIVLLAVKDKIKINSYERVYIVRGFVENRLRVRGGYMLRVRYHDFLRNEIKVITKTEPPELMFDNTTVVKGRGVELIMGEKNGKLSYITVNNPKLEL